jgi:hypothetical protein
MEVQSAVQEGWNCAVMLGMWHSVVFVVWLFHSETESNTTFVYRWNKILCFLTLKCTCFGLKGHLQAPFIKIWIEGRTHLHSLHSLSGMRSHTSQ